MKSFTAYLSQLIPVSDAISEFLATNFHPEPLKKGSFFIREGEYARDIAFLEDGVVRAFYTDPQGREYNKTFFEGPAIIGSYAALISKEKNRLPQQALTDCKIWRAKFGAIERFSERNFEAERLRRHVAERFFVQNENKQLEMALLEAKERYRKFLAEHPGIEGKIPQYHIASYLNITPTQLSRIRKNLFTTE